MARRSPLMSRGARQLVAAPILCSLMAVAALAAADPLTVIPDDALGLAVINNLSDTSARIQKLTEKMQLPVPELLPMAQLYTGAQQGVDDKGALAVAVFPADEDGTWSSMFAVFVPVTDYKAFVSQLLPDDATAEYCEVTVFGQTYLATQKGDFAVLASADGKPLLEKIKATSKGVAGALAPLKPWIAQQQLAVAITPAGKKLLAETLGGFLDSAIEGAEQAAADGNGADAQPAAEAVQSVSDTMRAVKDLLSAADDQVTQLGIGLRIDDTTALHLSGRLLFVPQGGLSQWAQEVKRPKAGLLAGLPPGKFALAYGGTSVPFHPAVAKVFQQVTQSGMTTLGLGEEDRKKLVEVMDRQSANQTSSGALLGQLRPGDSIVATSIQIQHVKDAAAQMKTSREMFELLAKTRIPGSDPPKAIYSLDDVTVGDMKSLEVTMDMGSMMVGAGDAEQAATEMVRGLLGKLLGNDGVMRTYLTVADPHTVVMAYSKEQLTRGVEHVRSGAAGLEVDEQIANTDKLLPEGAQWAAYVSPQGVIQWIDMVLKQFPDLNFSLPAFPPSDPIGLAARVSAEGLDAELVLPESVVAGIGQYIGVIQQMITQGGAPLP